ncbi:MAG: hypothetical protein LBD80_01815 [Tannerella sp.]|jgi:hypothetical protein|nr:hypothetical protein [Tannerella sp.]
MKRLVFRWLSVLAIALSTSFSTINAQGLGASAGGEIVSSYIWRGQDLGGVSIQPTATVSLGDFSITAWGSIGLESYDTKEFDFTFGYAKNGFSAAITDYWFNTVNSYFDYDDESTAHMIEATVGYDFGPAAVVFNTYFAGADYYSKDSKKRSYSTYIEASVPFVISDVNFKAEFGLTPWEGLYSDKFNVVNVGIKAGKELKISDSFSLPVFTKISFNPNSEKCWFVFGITL